MNGGEAGLPQDAGSKTGVNVSILRPSCSKTIRFMAVP
jgi:hypothetical protein